MRDSKLRFTVRKLRVRSSIRKNSDRLRLSVFKSGRHLYAQIIDDSKGVTLTSMSTQNKLIRKEKKSLVNKENAAKIGEIIGQNAAGLGISKVVFDKGGYKYHGVIKELADSARKHIEF